MELSIRNVRPRPANVISAVLEKWQVLLNQLSGFALFGRVEEPLNMVRGCALLLLKFVFYHPIDIRLSRFHSGSYSAVSSYFQYTGSARTVPASMQAGCHSGRGLS